MARSDTGLLKQEATEEFERTTMYHGIAQTLYSRNIDDLNKIRITDFEILKLLGKGSFAKVFLVKCTMNKKLYAMKVIRKDTIIDREFFDNIKLEKSILFHMNHPFIVQMEFVMQNENRIYFLLEFAAGGELFRHIIKERRFSED